jgi:hypothetical protein
LIDKGQPELGSINLPGGKKTTTEQVAKKPLIVEMKDIPNVQEEITEEVDGRKLVLTIEVEKEISAKDIDLDVS